MRSACPRTVLKKLLNDDQKAIKKWLKSRGSGLIQPFSIAQRSADEFVLGVLITEAHALYRYSKFKIYKQNLAPDVRNKLTRGLINYYYRYGVPHDIDVSDAVSRGEFTWEEFNGVKEEREDAYYYSVGLNPPRVRDVVRRDYGNMKYHFDIDEIEENRVRQEALKELRDSGAPPCGQKSILGLIYNCGYKKIVPATQ